MIKRKYILACFLFLATACQANTQSLNSYTSTPEIDVVLTETTHPDATAMKSHDFDVIIKDGWIKYKLPLSSPILSFTFDSNGALWTGLRGKVIKWDTKSGSQTEFVFENHEFEWSDVLMDKFGDIWITGYQYHNSQWQEHDFGSPFVSSPDGTIWAAELKFGEGDCVKHYDLTNWTEFCPPHDSDTNLIGLTIGPDNLLWASFTDNYYSHNEGVWRLNGTEWEKVDELSSRWPIYFLKQAPNGSLWAVGSQNLNTNENGAVKRFDGKEWLVYESHEMILGGINGISISQDNTLLALGPGYLLRFNNDEWEKIYLEQRLEVIFGAPIHIQVLGFNLKGLLCLGTNQGVICETIPHSFDDMKSP